MRFHEILFQIFKNKNVLFLKKKIKPLSTSKQKSFVYWLNFLEGFGSTDLSLLKGFLKNFSLEDFHDFHEICPNDGHELFLLHIIEIILSNCVLFTRSGSRRWGKLPTFIDNSNYCCALRCRKVKPFSLDQTKVSKTYQV